MGGGILFWFTGKPKGPPKSMGPICWRTSRNWTKLLRQAMLRSWLAISALPVLLDLTVAAFRDLPIGGGRFGCLDLRRGGSFGRSALIYIYMPHILGWFAFFGGRNPARSLAFLFGVPLPRKRGASYKHDTAMSLLEVGVMLGAMQEPGCFAKFSPPGFG